MAQINTFNDIYIYREFINENTLLIMAYHKKSSKFFQKVLTNNEWSSVVNNFTLVELDSIFKVCHEKQPGYDLQIVQSDNAMILKFVCKEKIKTYEWSVILVEKYLSDMEEISNIFLSVKNDLNTMIQKYLSLKYVSVDNNQTGSVIQTEPVIQTELVIQTEPVIQTELLDCLSIENDSATNSNIEPTNSDDEIVTFANSIITHLENQVKELFIKQKKELHLISYIAENSKSVDTKMTVDVKDTGVSKNSTAPVPKTAKKSSSKTSKPDKSSKLSKAETDKYSKGKTSRKIDSFEVEDSNSSEYENEYDTDYDSELEDSVSDDDIVTIPGYDRIDDITDVETESYVKYCLVAKDGKISNPIDEGYVRKISSSGRKITLFNHDGDQWKVDSKNTVFFLKKSPSKKSSSKKRHY